MLTHYQEALVGRPGIWVLDDGECVAMLKLNNTLARLLLLRARGPLSRPEIALLRTELFSALDQATGTKGHP